MATAWIFSKAWCARSCRHEEEGSSSAAGLTCGELRVCLFDAHIRKELWWHHLMWESGIADDRNRAIIISEDAKRHYKGCGMWVP